MKRRRASFTATCAALLGPLLLLSVTAARASFPAPDAIFWGSVAMNGSAAPDGTVVSGRVNGVELASHVLGSDPQAPDLYSLRVPMSEPESFFDAPRPGTAFTGYSVQLFVEGRFVAELVLDAGTLTRADLNDTGIPPSTFTATPPRPTPTITATRPSPVVTGTVPTAPATRTRTIPGPTRTRTAPGGTPTVTRITSGSPTETPTPTVTPLVVSCAGDCDGTGHVDVSELVRAVNIALDLATVDVCRAADTSNDGVVRINELIAAVRNALTQCP